MDEQFNFKNQYRNILFITLGTFVIITLGIIFITKPGATRIWANILLNNQYFLGLSLGAAFFLAIHRLALSGWHTLIQRIPDAMTTFLPIAFILMLLVYFGMHHLYIWTNNSGSDALIEGKKAWLNMPFFFIRLVIYFTGWISFTWLMRQNYSALMTSSDLKFYNRGKMFAGLFLVFYAVTVSSSSWDWIMSLDAHWYSTIFGWYVLIGMFVTSLAFITLMIWFLKRLGYLEYVRIDHIHDLAIYMFCFSIFWTYQWFAQYELIWYGHLPEETSYFITRLHHFRILFFINLGINFLVPFFGLITYNSKRNINWVSFIAAILLIGHWLDYWLLIMPAGAAEKATIGVFEICMTLIYACIFVFIVLRSLAQRPMVVKNDPFIKESLNYES
ncbi:MAG: hypothetical protein WA816_03280 [Bacteroidales bacterium]